MFVGLGGGRDQARASKPALIQGITELARQSRHGSSRLASLSALLEYSREELVLLADVVEHVVPTRRSREGEDTTYTSGPWDVLSNEVAAQLGDALRGIEPLLDELLPIPQFRIALHELRNHFKESGTRSLGEAQLSQAAIDALCSLDVPATQTALAALDNVAPDLADALRSELPLAVPAGKDVVTHPALLLWRVPCLSG